MPSRHSLLFVAFVIAPLLFVASALSAQNTAAPLSLVGDTAYDTIANTFPIAATTGIFNQSAGQVDFAVLERNPNPQGAFGDSIQIFHGKSDGTFTTSSSDIFPLGNGVGGADLKAGAFRNSCGCQDIAVATNAGIMFLENKDAMGTFEFPAPDLQSVQNAGTVASLAVGQFDGTGNYGVAANLGLGFSVFLGNGSGVFTQAAGSPYSESAPYTKCSAIVQGSFQGKPNANDLALRCYNISLASVFVYLNNGTGTFGVSGAANQTLMAGGTSAGGVAAGLLNNEPAIFAFGDTYVWNPVNSNFQAVNMDPLGTEPSGVGYTVLDNTLTTATDFAVVGISGLSLSTFTAYSTSTYPSGQGCPAGSVCGNWNSLTLGPGSVLASGFSQTINNGNNGLGTYVVIAAGVHNGLYPPLLGSSTPYVDERSVNVYLVTFNADGTVATTGAAPIYTGTGVNGYTLVPSFATGDFANHGNGIMDLAVSGTDLSTGEPTFTIYLANANGLLPSVSNAPVVMVTGPMYSGADAVVAGKFHGPLGNTDLALFSNQMNQVFIRNGDGAGNFAVGFVYSLSGAPGYPGSVYNPGVPGEGFAPVLTAIDVNGDHNTDLVLTIPENHSNCTGLPSEGAVYVFISNGDGTFQNPVFYVPPVVNPVSVTAANFSGLGYPDLVFADGGEVCSSNSPGALGNVAVGILHNNLSISAPFFVNPQPIISQGADVVLPNVTGVASADLNGDGFPDVVVSEAGGIAVALNNQHGGFALSTQTSQNPLPLYTGDNITPPTCVVNYCTSYDSGITAGDFYGNYNPSTGIGSADVAVGVGGVVYVFENKIDGLGTLLPPTSGVVAGPDSTGAPGAILNFSSGLSNVLAATSLGTALLVNNGSGAGSVGTSITVPPITRVTYPSPVTLTADLASAGGTVSAGSVTFNLCPQPSGACIQFPGVAVSGGSASTNQTVAPGMYNVTASYFGAGGFGSSGPSLAAALTVNVAMILVSRPTNVPDGSTLYPGPVTFSATVQTVNDGGAVVTEGSVGFILGNGTCQVNSYIATVNVQNGSATTGPIAVPVGTYTSLTACYSDSTGNFAIASRTSNINLTIRFAAVSATPPALPFGIQIDGVPLLPAVPGNPQSVTLTNAETSALPGVSETFVGPNATDFSVAATGTTCTATLNASSSCIINVVFAPSIVGGGPESATLSIAESASTLSPQTVTLSGTGQAFTVAPGSTSGALAAGQTYMTTINLTLAPGTSTLVLTCAGASSVLSLLNLNVACLFNGSPTLSIPQTGSLQMVTVTVTITTTKAMLPDRRPKLPPAGPFRWLPWSLIAAILGFSLWMRLSAAEQRRARAAWTFLALVVLCGGWMAACSSSNNSPSASSATPPGAYTFVVTAKLGNVTQTINLNLNVTQ